MTMTTVTGLPPMVNSLPGMAVDRASLAASDNARLVETARGRTPGAAVETLVPSAITGLASADKTTRLQDRRLAVDQRPDPDEPAGPPPTFSTTPLEKMRYPPSPLEMLDRQMQELVTDPGDDTRQLFSDDGDAGRPDVVAFGPADPSGPAALTGYESGARAVGAQSGDAGPALNVKA